MAATPTSGAALVYCRVSTKGQQDEGTSLQSQKAACVAHAEALGYTVGRVTEEVYTGSELWDRPLLYRDREDLKAGKFQALIAYAIDRLSRDPVHLAIIADECERAGAVLIFVTESLENSAEGQLIQFIKGYAAKVEREKIRERQIRGKLTRVRNGKIFNMGPELYGYRRDKAQGVRTIYEPEADVVRQVFTWIAHDQIGIVAAARRLNEQGVPPPSAGKMRYPDPDRVARWGKGQVAKLIRHPAYKGESVAWRTQRPASPKDRKRPDFNPTEARLIRPESQWITLPEGVTPPIVSLELWQAAQEALDRRTAAAKAHVERYRYLLHGHIWCKVCGKRMHSNVENVHTTHEMRTYRCSSRTTAAGACGSKRANADLVEAWAWEQVQTILRHPEVIASELERRRTAGADSTLQSDLEAARARVAAYEKAQAELLQRYTNGLTAGGIAASFPWELVEQQIGRVEREKVGWQQTVAELEERLQQQAVAVEQLQAVYDYCARVASRLDTFGYDEKRLALEALDIRVIANGRDWDIEGSIPILTDEQWAELERTGDGDGGDNADGATETGELVANLRRLWPPLAATSSARLTCSCPRTSARSCG